MRLTITREEYDALDASVRSAFAAIDNGNKYRHVDLIEANARVDEFRENNGRLTRANAALQSRLDATAAIARVVGERTPEQVEAAFSRLAQLEQAGVSQPDDIAARIEQAISPINAQVRTLTETITQKDRALDNRALESALTNAGIGGGVEDSMLDEFVEAAKRAGATWRNGGVVFIDSHGVQKFSSDGANMTPQSFIADLKSTKPRYFKSSDGFDGTGRPGSPSPQGGPRKIKRADAGKYLAELASGTVVYED